jgi:hypothetical protein
MTRGRPSVAVRWLGLLAVALLASGCMDDRSAPAPTTQAPAAPGFEPIGEPDAGRDGEEPENETALRWTFNGTFDFEMSQAAVLGGGFFLGRQCLSVPSGIAIESGHATATWDAQSPAAATLLVGFDAGPAQEGPSPLVLDLAGYETQDAGQGEDLLEVQFPRGSVGAAVGQTVRVDLEVAYWAPREVAIVRC